MSTALDFTVDIGSLPTRNQGPLKANRGMLVNKPQERRFESDKMLAEAPPISLENTMESQAPQTFVNKPQERVFEMQPQRQMMDPQLQQILQAQKDMSGIMMASLSGIPALMARKFDI